ncbi:hypothetical protein FKW77_002238 [Venturia effusa]|uniref:CorA-like transporter domain-containing protein n=1 Tax=Venturia effusa TaxID=50376 RepID=A0A517LGN4_9PEZI|nr:hypothetical protein FKW77_002238 [Venturia effusa]
MDGRDVPKDDSSSTDCLDIEFVDLKTCGIDNMIRSYDQNAAAIAYFEGRAGRIFHLKSQEKDDPWMDCYFNNLKKSPVLTESRRIEHPDEIPFDYDQAAFFIRLPRNSISRISSSRRLYDALVRQYDITPRFAEFTMSFGRKAKEYDFGPPTLRFRYVGRPGMSKDSARHPYLEATRGFECAYGFRYAFRKDDESEPWTVRQTAVYQRLDAKRNQTVWVLIGASTETALLVQKHLERSSCGPEDHPFLLHSFIIENSLGNWRWYILDLTQQVQDMADTIALSDVAGQDSSRRVEISVSFSDRQKLKTLEDKILNLRTMLESSMLTIASLRSRLSSLEDAGKPEEDKVSVLDHLAEASDQTSLYLIKVDVLRKQVKGAATLLSDILTYDNAFNLKVLAQEARKDNMAMIGLSEQAVEDSRAIRIITIITVVFLPATVVSSFFSTQFVRVELDDVRLSKAAWIYFVATAILMLLTIAAWVFVPTYGPKTKTLVKDTWHRFQKRTTHRLVEGEPYTMPSLQPTNWPAYQQVGIPDATGMNSRSFPFENA